MSLPERDGRRRPPRASIRADPARTGRPRPRSAPNHIVCRHRIELDVGEAGAAEDAADPVRLREPEGTGCLRRRHRQRRVPRPARRRTPGSTRSARRWPATPPSRVALRSAGPARCWRRPRLVTEEHRAGAADRHVERAGFERVDLGVGLLERRVVHAFGLGPPRGPRRASATRGRRPAPSPLAASRAASRVVCPVPQPTSSTRSVDAASRPPSSRRLWCTATDPVVVVGVGRPVLALVAVPRRELLGIRWCRHARVGLPTSQPPAGYSPFGRNRFSQRESNVKCPTTDLDVVRDPRPARGEAVDHLRAGPAGGPEPAADLAARRRASSTRSRRSWSPTASPGPRTTRWGGGRGPATRSQPKGRRALAAWVREPGRRALPRVRAAGQDPLRGQRHEGRRAGEPARDPRLGAGARTWRTWPPPAPTSSSAASFPERAALNQLSGQFIAAYYVCVAEWAEWAIGVVEEWPDDVTQAPFDLAVAEQAVRMVQSIAPAQSS